MEVTFTNSAPTSIQFYWDFGDSIFSTDPNPTHVYDSIGSFTVSFSCSSCVDTVTKEFYINTTYGEDVIYQNPIPLSPVHHMILIPMQAILEIRIGTGTLEMELLEVLTPIS